MATDVTSTGGDDNGGPGLRVQPRYPGTEARAGKFPGPSLIPALTAIQRRVGWLPREELVALSRDVRRPLYEIEGLISFYPHFRTSPPKSVQLAVCHDLTCWLHGADDRVREVRERYGDDVEIEIVEVSCLGRCDIAPAVAVDERHAPAVEAEERVEAARGGAHEPVSAIDALRPDRTGVDDPYEEPDDAEVVADTVALSPAESVALVMAELEGIGVVRPADLVGAPSPPRDVSV